jgi:hypothetical protein
MKVLENAKKPVSIQVRKTWMVNVKHQSFVRMEFLLKKYVTIFANPAILWMISERVSKTPLSVKKDKFWIVPLENVKNPPMLLCHVGINQTCMKTQ